MPALLRVLANLLGWPLVWLVGCDGSTALNSPGAAGSAAGAGSNTSGGLLNGGTAGSGAVGVGGTGHFFGETEIPGLEPSGCALAAPPPVFAIATGAEVSVPGPYIVLTGTLPPSIEGSPVAAVSVNGEQRGVRLDDERQVWTYFLAAPGGNLSVAAEAESGASVAPLSAQRAVGGSALPSRDITHAHVVGTWMFSWFSGDPSWQCSSAWRPVGGFAGWDGSVAWARDQLLDQLDAHIDAVGLQLDTSAAEGAEGYRFANVVHVLEAANDLLDEGVLPPRLFPFLDTAIISSHYQASQGSMLDLASEAGRAYFYQHASAFYDAAQTTFGSSKLSAGVARFQAGLPAVAAWHSESMTGVDDAAVLDFKARFAADFGSSCYFIGHPNDWRNLAAVDEITQMLGPPTHFLKTGHDGAGFPTVNLTAGFWNPTSNTFYLPRDGGSHFEQAWQSAQAEREAARHAWIDTWNETGEGSGLFAADTLTYTAADQGPCGDFVNTHADSWGSNGRHYIDATRAQASVWNDSPDFDAEPIASDVPETMRAGERRYVTVAMRNTGDRTWAPDTHRLGLTFSSAARDFHIAALGTVQKDALIERFGGVARGMPGVYTVLLTAPCTPGTFRVAFEIYDAHEGGFGTQLQVDIEVAP